MGHFLYEGSDELAWHARRWPQFQEHPSPETTLVIQPVYSLADWGMGRPLDAEEVVGARLLDEALGQTRKALTALVLPPFRFTPRQSVGTAFHLDIEVAHRALAETLLSAAFPGFKRFVLFNTSPLLEEWIDVAARDLRVDHELQMFCMNLSGVGLDFHPVRGGSRAGLDSILTELLGQSAGPVDGATVDALDPLPDAVVKTNESLGTHPGGAAHLMEDVVSRMVRLLCEINTHPPLEGATPNRKELK